MQSKFLLWGFSVQIIFTTFVMVGVKMLGIRIHLNQDKREPARGPLVYLAFGISCNFAILLDNSQEIFRKTKTMAELLLLAGIGVLFLCLILTLLALLLLSGLFETIEVKTGKPPLGEVVIAYKFCRGPYKECGPVFTEVCGLTPQGQKTVGIYYDDPEVVRFLFYLLPRQTLMLKTPLSCMRGMSVCMTSFSFHDK